MALVTLRNGITRTLWRDIRDVQLFSSRSSVCCTSVTRPVGEDNVSPQIQTTRLFSSTPIMQKITAWPSYNKKIFDPQEVGEPRRPAYVCHYLENVSYSPKKLWYFAVMVRGMSVGEALKQLQFQYKKGAGIVTQAIEEAVEIAVRDHNVEYRTNLWIAESFCLKGKVIKSLRRHARKRMGIIQHRHSNYFIRLEEGPPPKVYYPPHSPELGPEMLKDWIEERRQQTIPGSL